MAEQTLPRTDQRARFGRRAAPPHGASVRSHRSRRAAQ